MPQDKRPSKRTPKKTTQRKPAPAAPRSVFELVRSATIIYGGMCALALVLIKINPDISLRGLFSLPSWDQGRDDIGRLIATTVLCIGLLIVSSQLFESYFASFRQLKKVVTDLMGPTPLWVGIFMALISGFSEELLFRAGIQPFAGLGLAAILFGFLHLGPQGRLSAWSYWAVLAGLLLGWVFHETQNLWPPIIAHVTINMVSLIAIQRQYQRSRKIIKQLKKIADSLPLKSGNPYTKKKKADDSSASSVESPPVEKSKP